MINFLKSLQLKLGYRVIFFCGGGGAVKAKLMYMYGDITVYLLHRGRCNYYLSFRLIKSIK